MNKPEKGQVAVFDPSTPTGFNWEYVLGIGNRHEAIFTPTQGQTEFILPDTPLMISGFFINGVHNENQLIDGNKVIYTGNAEFELLPSDSIRIYYYN